MLEILQFYVSGFWVWFGITIGLCLVLQAVINIIATTTRKGGKDE